uniref:Uncharacterized protein n=1 Tax=Sterkiella nova TaxID=200597 RepID=Q9U4E2_STENO|nr:unknown protein [Sterkiella nova]
MQNSYKYTINKASSKLKERSVLALPLAFFQDFIDSHSILSLNCAYIPVFIAQVIRDSIAAHYYKIQQVTARILICLSLCEVVRQLRILKLNEPILQSLSMYSILCFHSQLLK